jgi:GNAT superfamily N-acetyltransferase
MDSDRIARLLTTWARDAAAFAETLATLEPSWSSEASPVAGGWLVLSGRGMYVNRVLGAGIDVPLDDADVGFVTRRSASVGVPPAFEVSPLTHGTSLAVLEHHGFAPDRGSPATAMVWPIDRPLPASPMDVVIRSISTASIADWQHVSAIGWGHTGADARRVSDAFTSAAHAIDGDGMVIAHDARDGRPVGCASLTRRDGVATLGGMSTIPTERRRGVQAALVRHRIEVALDAGCDLITSSAASGSASERNLQRLGFVAVTTITTFLQS